MNPSRKRNSLPVHRAPASIAAATQERRMLMAFLFRFAINSFRKTDSTRSR
jgi:hypothetical protein